MNDLSQRVQAFLDAYAGDAPTDETVETVLGMAGTTMEEVAAYVQGVSETVEPEHR